MKAKDALKIAKFVDELQAMLRTHGLRLRSETPIQVIVTDGTSGMSDIDVVDAGVDYMVIE